MSSDPTGPPVRARTAVAFVALGLVWGTTPLTIKAGLLADWQPLWFCALRLLGAAVVLAPLLLTSYAGRPLGPAGWRVIWPVGVFGMAVNFGVTVWGQQFIGAALASLIAGTQPVTTALVVHLAQRRVPTRRFAAGLTLGMVGMVVVFRGAGVPGPSAAAGAAAVLAGVTIYGAVFVYIKARLGGLNLLRVVAGQNLIGGALVALAAVAFEGSVRLPGGTQAWSAYTYLTLVSSIVALLLANWLIGRMGAARFSVLSFVTPLVGVAAGVVLLDETLDGPTLVGAALVGTALLATLGPEAEALGPLPAGETARPDGPQGGP